MSGLPKIVAKNEDESYLIYLGDDDNGLRIGQVLDIPMRTLFSPNNIVSILSRGYWEDEVIENNDPRYEELLELVGAKHSDILESFLGMTSEQSKTLMIDTSPERELR